MHIMHDTAEINAIQAYTDRQIQINSTIYDRSLIVSNKEIISGITIKSIQDIDQALLNQCLNLHPEVILIGQQNRSLIPPPLLLAAMAQHKIGIEFMSIGAACRTYNILLSEKRAVLALFVFDPILPA